MIDFWIFPLSTIWGAYQNQDFTGIYFGEYIKYTELEGFEDYYEKRGVEMK